MNASFRRTWCLTCFLRKSLATNSQYLLLTKHPSSSKNFSRQNHVAIVGSGPAGFYSAQQILKGNSQVKVDVFEKLPVPFGLVRFGVAPDHPEVKNVINTFNQTAKKDQFTFVGNVEVGKDVSLETLRQTYSAVILSYGASDDRLLQIPGENLSNVLSARSFVGWYNGLPEDKELQVSLDCESAVVLGHGNVALDVARILLSPLKLLEKTDITEYALEALSKSRIKQVYLVGRRGPLQVAFTIKELRELVKLPGVHPVVNPLDVQGLDVIIPNLPRPRKRLTDLIHRTAASPTKEEVQKWADNQRKCHVVFKRSPLCIDGTEDGKAKAVTFVVNQLQGDNFESQFAVPTEKIESIECGLVLRSIGYRSLPLDESIPFDARKGVIPNHFSRVEGQKGLYCAGWVGTGPVGVILSTMTNGFDTGKVVLQDLKDGLLPCAEATQRDALMESLKDKAVSFKDWEKIDAVEKANGQKKGKPREKITDLDTMVSIASG